MKRKLPKWIFPAVLLAVLFVATILIGIYFIVSTEDDIDRQNKQYLREIAIQNASIVKSTVQMEIDRINAVTNIIGSREDFSLEYAMQVLATESKRSSFKRLGFISPDGNAITTDNMKFSVLDRDYFEKAVNGESSVSDRIIDKIDGRCINVYAVPLYHKSKLAGVVFATNDTTVFSNLLETDSFGGEGFSYIIKKSGAPVAYAVHKNSLLEFDNLFEEMRKNGVNEDDIAVMQRNMDNNIDGLIEYRRENSERVAAYSSVGVNDWFVVSVVPKDVIFKNTDRLILRNIISVVMTVALLCALQALIVIQNHKNRQNLVRLAYVDPVTGGYNLNKFKQLAAQVLEKTKGDKEFMLRLDIDNFKLINDLYGHAEGDEVLINMYKQITEMISGGDIFGRIYSDNFILLIRGKSEDEILKRCGHFNSTFKNKMNSDGKSYTVNFTIGIYKIPFGETDIDKIIDRATMAHRNAKLIPTDMKFSFYDEGIRDDAIRVKHIENTMRGALADGEFIVYFQPKYEMSGGNMTGAEALVRWVRDDLVIPPSEFIPVFEKNGFIVNIDLYVLEEVCRLQRKWLDAGLSPVPISVNQSKSLVYSKDYIRKLQDIFAKYDLPPRLIELELLETIIHDNLGELKKITSELRSKGILICIDDFGSGYSSLNMLKDICADVLKIDRGFLSNAESGERSEIVLASIIGLAKSLNMSIVTEGVETQKQADLLIKLECDVAQGFLYARPMPVDQFETLLAKD